MLEALLLLSIFGIMMSAGYLEVKNVIMNKSVWHEWPSATAQQHFDPGFFGYHRWLMRTNPKYKIVINRAERKITIYTKPTLTQLFWNKFDEMEPRFTTGGMIDLTDEQLLNKIRREIDPRIDDLIRIHYRSSKKSSKMKSDITQIYKDLRNLDIL
jgi:hypothetical protein